jgi:copper homeostasis protein CutC
MRPITTSSDCADFARLYGRTPAAIALEALVVALTNATMQAIERDRHHENVDPTDAIEAEQAVQLAAYNWSRMMTGGQNLALEDAVTEWRRLIELAEMDRIFNSEFA